MREFTTVATLNEKTLDHFHAVIPTWQTYCPELWNRPMVVLYDVREIDVPIESAQVMNHPDCTWVPFPLAGPCKFPGDRMQSAALIGCGYCVETEWWLKLDPMAFATGAQWYCPEWFDNDPDWIGGYRDKQMSWSVLWGKTSFTRKLCHDLTTEAIPGKIQMFGKYLESKSENKLIIRSGLGFRSQSNLSKLRLKVVESLYDGN